MSTPKKSKSGSKYARFSTAGIQMGIIIGGFTWLGTYLDKKYQTNTPWWTICLSLFGVVAGFYVLIKEVINMNKDDEK